MNLPVASGAFFPTRLVLVLALAEGLTSGCGDSPSQASQPDAGRPDASPAPDAGPAADAAAPDVTPMRSYLSCATHVGRDPICPAQPPEHDTACPSAGAVCDYTRHDGWDSCRCRDPGDGALKWRCFGFAAGYDCPLGRPQHGAACAGEAGRRCSFLRDLGCSCEADRALPLSRNVTCACGQDETWRCENEPTPKSAAAGKETVEDVCINKGNDLDRPPLNEAVPVADLNDADATAWCRWFVRRNRGDGPPPPSRPPVTNPDGSVSGYAFSWCLPPIDACVAAVPEDICLLSLRRQGCRAPLSALTDCYLTLTNACDPVGRACTLMRSTPGCLQTVVQLDRGEVGPAMPCAVPLR